MNADSLPNIRVPRALLEASPQGGEIQKKPPLPMEQFKELSTVWEKFGFGIGLLALTRVFSRKGPAAALRIRRKAGDVLPRLRQSSELTEEVVRAQPTSSEIMAAKYKQKKRNVCIEMRGKARYMNIRALLERSQTEFLPQDFKVLSFGKQGDAIRKVIAFNQKNLLMEVYKAEAKAKGQSALKEFMKSWERMGYICTAIFAGAFETFMQRTNPTKAHQHEGHQRALQQVQEKAGKTQRDYEQKAVETKTEIASIFAEVDQLVNDLPHHEQEQWRTLTQELQHILEKSLKKDEQILKKLVANIQKQTPGEPVKHSQVYSRAFLSNTASCLLGIGLSLFLGKFEGVKKFKKQLIEGGMPARIVNEVLFASLASMSTISAQHLLSQKIERSEAEKTAHSLAHLVDLPHAVPRPSPIERPIVNTLSSMVTEVASKLTAAFAKPAVSDLIEVTSKTVLNEVAGQTVIRDFSSQEMQKVFADKAHQVTEAIERRGEAHHRHLTETKRTAKDWKGKVSERVASEKAKERERVKQEPATLGLLETAGKLVTNWWGKV